MVLIKRFRHERNQSGARIRKVYNVGKKSIRFHSEARIKRGKVGSSPSPPSLSLSLWHAFSQRRAFARDARRSVYATGSQINAWIRSETAESRRRSRSAKSRDAKSKLKEHSRTGELGKSQGAYAPSGRFIVQKVREPEPTTGNN